MPGPEELRVPDVEFRCEQDGEPERALKKQLIANPLFAASVFEAYLMRVSYPGEPDERVALCVVVRNEAVAPVVAAASEEFRRLFRTDQALDILRLTKELREQARSLADPFFTRAGSASTQ